MIVETEAITYPQWKAVDDLTKAEVVKKAVKPNAEQMLVKKEIHHIAQKELERTIDKLIESLTRVSNDGKFEESDINKSIEDMSKVMLIYVKICLFSFVYFVFNRFSLPFF